MPNAISAADDYVEQGSIAICDYIMTLDDRLIRSWHRFRLEDQDTLAMPMHQDEIEARAWSALAMHRHSNNQH